jgi:tetratricopeptide (TPR) repeat protein
MGTVGIRSFASVLMAAACLLGTGCGEGGREDASTDQPAVAVSLPEGAQALSLLGEPLFPPSPSEEVQARRQEQLAEALEDLEADPEGAESLIWAGRRYAYMGEYRRAIEVYTTGIELHPSDARFYRHRGHRYISVREFDRAIADFRVAADLIEGTADELEPDGQPNAMGIPTSTLHFNIWYHYGLAHFLKGEFEEAEPIYRQCMEASVHPDSKVATAHWLYMTLRRLGKEVEAREFIEGLDLEALAPDVIESGSYLELLRIYTMAEAGGTGSLPEMDPETMEGAALGYGLGNFHLYNGRVEEARAVFEGILAARDQWAAFGYIAAEADLARLGGE